ncbi:MAG: hypothetical protein ACRC68_01535 [Clostridium sp.]
MKENKLDVIKAKLDDIGDIMHRNSKVKYISFTFIFLGGLIFFLSSNMLFNNTSTNDVSTLIGTPISNGQISVTLKDRAYNPMSGFIKFFVDIENTNKNKKYAPSFELRSKDNPNELIPVVAHQIVDDKYVIYTTYNKKWSYLSLGVNLTNESDVDEIIGPFKMYSTLADTELNEILVQKSNKDYYAELVDSEIKDIKLEIDNLNETIKNNLEKVENVKNENIKLEDDKKYQIDSEVSSTDSDISSNTSMADRLIAENKEADIKIKNLEEKISKLEIKKTDYLKGN